MVKLLNILLKGEHMTEKKNAWVENVVVANMDSPKAALSVLYKVSAFLLVFILLVAVNWAIAGQKYEYTDDLEKKEREKELSSMQAKIGYKYYVFPCDFLSFYDLPGHSRSFYFQHRDEFQIIGLITKKDLSPVEDYYKLRLSSGKIAYISVFNFDEHNQDFSGYDQIRLQEDNKQPTPEERQKLIAEDNQENIHQIKKKKTSGGVQTGKAKTLQGGLIHYDWNMGGFGTVAILSSITIGNSSDTPCRDIQGIMSFYAKSGTKLGEQAFTIYDVISPKEIKTFKHINVGFANSQVSGAHVEILNCH